MILIMATEGKIANHPNNTFGYIFVIYINFHLGYFLFRGPLL